MDRLYIKVKCAICGNYLKKGDKDVNDAFCDNEECASFEGRKGTDYFFMKRRGM